MFQLTKEECSLVPRFQIETSSCQLSGHGGRRYLPYVFTEEGVAMLATVLRTEIAERISIQIMDAFTAMRRYLSSNNLLEDEIVKRKFK